jgi:hypothetical protein
MAVWRKYFGPDALIFGIDIDQRCALCSTVTRAPFVLDLRKVFKFDSEGNGWARRRHR